jgi:biopolymer transport protein TolR
MAFQLNNKKKVIADINVTPLVDVMLVLLVIFMISAPLMFSGVKLDLPKTKKVHNLRLTKKQVVLSLKASGEYFVGTEKYLVDELFDVITKQLNETQLKTLYIRADETLPYGKVAKVMSLLKSKGITKLALVTEIEKK